jgi:mannose/cellobiose epimerase-like protein (N-acyl-D-glucosamine 2-epimerase family)
MANHHDLSNFIWPILNECRAALIAATVSGKIDARLKSHILTP